MNDIRRIVDETLADRLPAELAESLTQQIAAFVDEAADLLAAGSSEASTGSPLRSDP